MIGTPVTAGPGVPPAPAAEVPAASIVLPGHEIASPWLFEMATLDFGGRFHPRDAAQNLRWQPYTDVAMRMAADRVTITRVTRQAKASYEAVKLSLDGRGRMRLPDAHRQRLGVAPGDRVMVATNRVWLWRRRRNPVPDELRAPWGSGIASTVNETGAGPGLPAWPEDFAGYRFDREATASLRLSGGAALTVIPDFPATMNGGAHQRFFIRWRALGDHPFAASRVSMPDLITLNPAVVGSAGWMASDGCGQPAWQAVASDSSIDDIQVNWQVWVPAA